MILRPPHLFGLSSLTGSLARSRQTASSSSGRVLAAWSSPAATSTSSSSVRGVWKLDRRFVMRATWYEIGSRAWILFFALLLKWMKQERDIRRSCVPSSKPESFFTAVDGARSNSAPGVGLLRQENQLHRRLNFFCGDLSTKLLGGGPHTP
jgi:hypothetical protein